MTSADTLEVENGLALERPPKIICVGTGRDGTLSVAHMIQDIFDRTDGRRVFHEYGAREFYNAFSEYRETGDERFTDEIVRLIRQCPFDCIVGNGYAAILPYFRELWGPQTRLIHIRRADRSACIASLVKNAELFPVANRYYATAAGATVKRLAGFHLAEMTREEWERTPLAAKFGWYYDKTHALIDQYKGLFAMSIEVSTETLSEEPTRRAIARLVTGSDEVVPAAARLHAYAFDIASVPQEYRDKAMWVWGQVNWDLLVKDDAYAIEYLLTKFLQWKERQVKGDPLPGVQQSRAEITAALARTRRSLTAAIKDISALELCDGEGGD
jgi:hypothetical protein